MRSLRLEDEGRQIVALRDGDIVHLHVADGEETSSLYFTNAASFRLALWMLWHCALSILNVRSALAQRRLRKQLLDARPGEQDASQVAGSSAA